MKWLRFLLALIASTLLTIYCPPVATAFLAVWATNRLKCNSYLKVLAAIGISWIFCFCLLNCLEIAVLVGIFPLVDFATSWWWEVEKADRALGGVVVGSYEGLGA